MTEPKKSVYARLASRFAHLSLGAKEEDEEDKDASAEEEPEEGDDEDAKEEEPKGKKAKKAKKGDKDCPSSEEEEDEEEARSAASEEDEDDEDKEKKARAFERARWAAVLSSAEAKGRVPLACSLLADTDMPEDKIRSALLASPAHGEPIRGLAARMAAVQRYEIGSGPAATPPDPTNSTGKSALMLGAYDKALGRKPEAR